MKSLGICIGASTISTVSMEYDENRKEPRIIRFSLHPHEGDPRQTVLTALKNYDLNSFNRIAATGRKFKSHINLTTLPEPEAVEYAYRYVKPRGIDCPAVVSAGGETFMVYALNRAGQISNVFTGNKCASGTGEFFLQQIRRMNVSLEQAARWSAEESPHHVSGRCSVFCKSDCTHATNKGVPKSKVTAGLCQMMAGKILQLLKKVPLHHVMICGGTSRNQMMIHYLKQEIPDLIVPEEAPYFEALGAALWAMDHETTPFPEVSNLIRNDIDAFDSLPPLRDSLGLVEFKHMPDGVVCPGDVCLLGLDVGSTTTKAVLIRKKDTALLASEYLRTNGDPVEASRRCYRSLQRQISRQVDSDRIVIEGLGVCGSGRQIAGLHALTDAVINEIIAHATAAVYFDPGVDTIFEIGGQDAKYTYITNGVASDYAMNEACSAGTGSFLEESALETLGVQMEDIADIAMEGRHPPNFNDQCAAFIASDIKNAIHEGVAHEDVVAGLVYSICMNYSNRVKGNRPVGEKIFMQGGVCYNHAVPAAMARLIGKPIIVPPHPGLMGAFGVALETANRIDTGLIEPKRFDLKQLAGRQVSHGKSFVCKGGKQSCDRRCTISVIKMEGKAYPFGGACNRYDNLRRHIRYDTDRLNLVRYRGHLIFDTYGISPGTRPNQKTVRGTVAFNRSFMVHTYYPLYSTFFNELGFIPVLPQSISQEGIDQIQAAFCYPVELAHGFFHRLLDSENPPDVIFLPHFKAIPSQDDRLNSFICPLAQGEPYYLKTTFRKKLSELNRRGTRIFSPLIDLKSGLENARVPLIDTAVQMGLPRRDAVDAFEAAVLRQRLCFNDMKQAGARLLNDLQKDPSQTAVVLLSRPYNGFADEANMGIPHKLASRGIRVLPLDFLPLENETSKRHMYWGMGQLLLKAARFVQHHPQLFGVCITNFSCGPDSFIIGYVRDIMGQKPSLTLELDNHTADAGLETRIEAFLDIVNAYRRLQDKTRRAEFRASLHPARTVMAHGRPNVISSSGKQYPLSDPRVTVLLPSMGHIASESLGAVFRSKGINAFVHPPATEAILKLGRAHTSCKECLPLILTTGILINYIRHHKRDDEIVIYFMPTGSGPCRFGQYYIFMEDLIQRMGIADVALMSPSSDDAYTGLDRDFHTRGWWAVIISDVMEDIRSMLLANAVNRDTAMKVFSTVFSTILMQLEQGNFHQLEDTLRRASECLRQIPLKTAPKNVPLVSVSGEIFVRRDSLSRQFLTERLADKGFAAVCSPISEWLHYTDYLVTSGLTDEDVSVSEKIGVRIRKSFKRRYEKRIKAILSDSGLVRAYPIHLNTVIDQGRPFLSPELTGEAILTIGSALNDIVSHVCGVIAVGPFGCMPNRMAEAILTETMKCETKIATSPQKGNLQSILNGEDDLPFLGIESDGSPFPQLITAKLESFCLRARRLHDKMLQESEPN